jgi:hypothetical protein
MIGAIVAVYLLVTWNYTKDKYEVTGGPFTQEEDCIIASEHVKYDGDWAAPRNNNMHWDQHKPVCHYMPDKDWQGLLEALRAINGMLVGPPK